MFLEMIFSQAVPSERYFKLLIELMLRMRMVIDWCEFMESVFPQYLQDRDGSTECLQILHLDERDDDQERRHVCRFERLPVIIRILI